MPHSDPYATGVLKPEVHDRLVKNIHAISRRSGLGPSYEHLIWEDPELLSDGEEDFIRKVVVHRKYGSPWDAQKVGIAYGRSSHPKIDTVRQVEKAHAVRLRELTAKLVRNFVDARLMSPMEIIEASRQPDGLDASVLLVRDFMLPEEWAGKGDEKFYSKSQREQLDVLPRVLMDRAQKGCPTVVHVRSPATTLATYMPSLYDLFQSQFAVTDDLAK